MTFIKLSDIREIDVAPEAGMSNVPWEYDYGFQIIEDVSESQEDILSSKYNYKSESNEDGVLDGLCSAIGKKKVILIDDIYHPLSQILDLRGLPSIGYIEWVEDDDVCEI